MLSSLGSACLGSRAPRAAIGFPVATPLVERGDCEEPNERLATSFD
jgi:hypothetical protein